MKTKHPWRRYRSEAFAAIHATAKAMHRVGGISKVTMREFDESCLENVETIKPAQIRALREREHVSQPVFARYLNVSKNLVSDWERGKKKPGGPALRLLSVIRNHGIETIA
jgi:putative transcriptional regulator